MEQKTDKNYDGLDINSGLMYYRVPINFLKGVNLVPHNFNLPEKQIHGAIVNRQLREDLFDTIFKKVQDIETPRLVLDNDYFKIQNIDRATCDSESIIERLGDYMSKTDPEDQFIQCEAWTVAGEYNGEAKSLKYKVKVVQTVNDHFYTIVHPDSLWKGLRLYSIYYSL